MAQTPRADKGLKCPLWKKDMSQVCHTCPWWVSLQVVVNVTTQESKDEWGCAVTHLPRLLIQSAQQTRGAAAATENMRNHIVGALEDTAKVIVVAGADPVMASNMLDELNDRRMKLIESN